MPVIINPTNIANKEFVVRKKPLVPAFDSIRPGAVHNMRPPPVVYPRITHIILLLQACAIFI